MFALGFRVGMDLASRYWKERKALATLAAQGNVPIPPTCSLLLSLSFLRTARVTVWWVS